MTIEHERAGSRRALKAALSPSKMKRLLGRLEEATEHLAGVESETSHGGRPRSARHVRRWALEARVVHRATRAVSAIQSAGVLYAPERLHDARIAVKRLRYAAELLSADIATLRSAQDVLGQLHDFEVLIERVRREQVTLTPPDLTAWRELKRLVDALENDCRRGHGMFVQQLPKLLAIVRELGAPTEAVPSSSPARARAATR